jgi:hypothetical protein
VVKRGIRLARKVPLGPDYLSCPLGRTRAFVQVIEAVHPAPLWDVPAQHIRWEDEGEGTRLIIAGVGAANP